MEMTPNPLRDESLKKKVCICGSGKLIRQCCAKDHFITQERFDILERELAEVFAAQAQLEKASRGHF
jgi:hypothetical protein